MRHEHPSAWLRPVLLAGLLVGISSGCPALRAGLAKVQPDFDSRNGLAALARVQQARILSPHQALLGHAIRPQRGPSIHLRSAADVVVLTRPSWFTLRHALIVLGIVVGLALWALAWAVWLRRRVREQTAVIDRDIAERRRSEKALRERSAYLDALIRMSPLAIAVHDTQGKVQMCNPAFEQLFLYSATEVLGGSLDELIAPIEKASEATAFSERALSGQSVHAVTERRRKDGTRVDVELHGVPLMVDGRQLGALALYQDISERKRAQEARDRLALIVESTDDAVIGIGPNQTILSWNRGAEKLFGYTLEEVRGKPVSLLVPPEHHDRLARVQQSVARGETVSHFEGFALTKDGRRVDISVTVFPLAGSGGRFPGSAAIVRDITARKRAEEELYRAKEAAEAANRAKSEFLAVMSHEIRTPMNGIIGMTELMLETDLAAEQRGYLNMVKESADALLTIINDILDFSRIEAGKLGLDLSEFDLAELLGSTLKGLAVRAHQKGLELAFRMAPELPAWLVGDSGRLRQVLVNLLGNAIKFTERGEVVLSVEAESRADNAVALHFRVTDTGIGVPEAQRRKIFEAFAQADSSTTRRYGGAGLGLSISARLVEMMGGRIWVESEAGGGSAFHFTARFGLPRTSLPHSAQSAQREGSVRGLPAQPALEAVPAEVARLRGLPVLVVDDNATSRDILESTLGHWGVKATLVENGPAALAALREAQESGQPFACALVAAQMPGMDGFTLAQRMLGIGDSGWGGGRNPNQRGIIMMLTTTRPHEDAARCRELGLTYLVKPLLPRELLAALLAALGARRVETESSVLSGVTPARNPRIEISNLKGLHVLVVEDSAVNRELIVRLLQKRGHTAEVAANGREALGKLERAATGRFDLALMDVQMPEMDGFEATRAIREKEKAAGTHLPIVAMTAHALKGDPERCLAAGMDGYVAKPIRASELFVAIETLLAVETEKSAGARKDGKGRGRVALDAEELLARFEGDTQLLKQVTGVFLSDYPKLLAEMRAAVDRQEAPVLERAAHTLKSSLGIFMARQALEAAEEVETMAHRRDLTRAGEAVRRLEEEIEHFKPALGELGEGAVT